MFWSKSKNFCQAYIIIIIVFNIDPENLGGALASDVYTHDIDITG